MFNVASGLAEDYMIQETHSPDKQETRVCTLCHQEKPKTLEFFRFKKSNFERICKKCQSQRNSAYNSVKKAKDPEAFLRRQRELSSARKLKIRKENENLVIDPAKPKTCTRCHFTKPSSEFYKNQSDKTGLTLECKKCVSERQKGYAKERREEREREAAKIPKPLLTDERTCRKCGEIYPQTIPYFRIFNVGKKNECVSRICKKCHNKSQSEQKKIARLNPDVRKKLDEHDRLWGEKYKLRNKTNPILTGTKICSNCGTEKDINLFPNRSRARDGRLNRCKECHNKIKRELLLIPKNKLMKSLRGRFNKITRSIGVKKSNKTIKLLGCSINFFKDYIESLFKEGMSWENYNHNTWHIDHIIPCSSFDLTIEENQYKCFNYLNLQPLFSHENLSKRDKIEKRFGNTQECLYRKFDWCI